ncbi:conserved hypothetical protein [Methanolacinia petrolearia DSM 11571]|uniref:DUF1894 domain-containing protein n=1 Tax=Methanolacinia petrolearia (strain DSM 11571 / OCM 486 / SEBR 4847) TaxID=679926 RepID=E1RIG3_METP4|nr:DUF1894 domain-containing protein [Methanolacinia petrolearia]ADN35476.1 conserved hypothetical protein [Methanolacinia petrolearia DSM 11571]
MNRCVNKLCPDIIDPEIKAEDAVEYIFKKSSEVYEMPEHYTIKGVNILGEAPLYVGLLKKKKEILFYFKKPCFGTMLLKTKGSDEEFEKIREQGKLVPEAGKK